MKGIYSLVGYCRTQTQGKYQRRCETVQKVRANGFHFQEGKDTVEEYEEHEDVEGQEKVQDVKAGKIAQNSKTQDVGKDVQGNEISTFPEPTRTPKEQQRATTYHQKIISRMLPPPRQKRARSAEDTESREDSQEGILAPEAWRQKRNLNLSAPARSQPNGDVLKHAQSRWALSTPIVPAGNSQRSSTSQQTFFPTVNTMQPANFSRRPAVSAVDLAATADDEVVHHRICLRTYRVVV